jgi:hypothetical protein
MRCHEQLRRGHHGRGTKAHAGPAKPDPVYNRDMIENPLSLTLLGETPRLVLIPRKFKTRKHVKPCKTRKESDSRDCEANGAEKAANEGRG